MATAIKFSRLEKTPRFHVRGATKIYRRECWEQIGGLWPAAGWGIIDSRGVPKAPYYYLRRSWRPWQITVTDEGLDGLHLHITNESAEPLDQVLDADLDRTLAGELDRGAHASAFHRMIQRSSSFNRKLMANPISAITNRPTYMRATAKVSHALQIM